MSKGYGIAKVLRFTLLLFILSFQNLSQTAYSDTVHPNAIEATRPTPPENLQLLSTFFAPAANNNYCSSAGGSTFYESISDVKIIRPTPQSLQNIIEIIIANPTGCSAGDPCPEYDNSPEYVNAWIDWDKDIQFGNDEKILDAALTGYLNINYQGTMTTSFQVAIPQDASGITTLRANLGWGYDPNDPCEYSWTWGDVLDKEIMIKPELEIKKGLKQYTGSNIKEKVFRRKNDVPTFEVTALPEAGESIKVDIFRQGNNPIRTLDTVDKGNNIYSAVWGDWKSSEWSQIPDDIPVGEYRAKAKVVKNGVDTVFSEEQTFYVIYDTPQSLSAGNKKAFLYDDAGTRDEIGVWYYPKEFKDADNKVDGGDYSMRYLLQPFKEDVFLKAIEEIKWEKDPAKSMETLSKFISNSYTYELTWQGVNSSGQHDVLTLLNKTGAECSDMANLLSAYLRSVGIASHSTAIDASPKALAAKGNTVWGYHTWAEGYVDGKWQASDPHDHLVGYAPKPRRDFGTSGKWAYIKKVNDIVLAGSSSFSNSKLGKASNFSSSGLDIHFDFNPDDINSYNSGISVPEAPPLNHLESWVTDLSHDYWGEHSYSARDLNDPPLNVHITTDKPSYSVGELLTANIVLENPDTFSKTIDLNFQVVEISSPGKIPGTTSLHSETGIYAVPPLGSVNISKTFILPTDLNTAHQFYVTARDLSSDSQTDISYFDVNSLILLTENLPDSIDQGNTETLTITLNNNSNEALQNVSGSLLYNSNMLNVLSSETINVGQLAAGATEDLDWHVEAIGQALDELTFEISSDNGGTMSISKFISVNLQPVIDLPSVYVEFPGGAGVPFDVDFMVRNLGNLPIQNIGVELTLPSGISATQTVWNIAQLAGGEELQLTTTLTISQINNFNIESTTYKNSAKIADGNIWIAMNNPSTISLTGNYLDYGQDSNGNGKYETLIIDTEVNAVISGHTYTLEGWLYDSTDSAIAHAENQVLINTTGISSIPLTFDGPTIFLNNQDGPYYLRNVILRDQANNLMDGEQDAYTTSGGYLYTDFELPLVHSPTILSDFGEDSDADGDYDFLVISLNVSVASSGNVFAEGFLVDGSGNEIDLATGAAFISEGPPGTILMQFSGEKIFANMQNGPYYLKNLSIYHAGDPTQGLFIPDAYMTAQYNYTDFDPVPIVLGAVMDDGQPVNATLQVDSVGSTDTDSLGAYSFVFPSAGHYTLTIDAPGYGDWKIYKNGTYVHEGTAIDFDITSEEVIQIDFKQITVTAGDLNGDGMIDATDRNVLRAALGGCVGDPQFNSNADYDGDGCITYADYRLWYNYYKLSI